MTDETQIPNPYLAAIRSQRSRAVPVATDLRDDLDAVRTAMDAGAWVSTMADTFYSELTTHRTTLGTAADGVLGSYDDAIGQQPATVESGAWQTRWRNLR